MSRIQKNTADGNASSLSFPILSEGNIDVLRTPENASFTLDPTDDIVSLKSMGSISVRRSIQWLPDDPAPVEPTSTVVLTSPGKRFVDIRILLPDAGARGGGGLGGKGGESDELEVAHRDFGKSLL